MCISNFTRSETEVVVDEADTNLRQVSACPQPIARVNGNLTVVAGMLDRSIRMSDTALQTVHALDSNADTTDNANAADIVVRHETAVNLAVVANHFLADGGINITATNVTTISGRIKTKLYCTTGHPANIKIPDDQVVNIINQPAISRRPALAAAPFTPLLRYAAVFLRELIFRAVSVPKAANA